MFRRTLAAVVTSASGSLDQSALFVGYDIESDEERARRLSLRLDTAQAHSPPPAADLPAPPGPTP